MRVHANAKLGPAGRIALVRSIESGYRCEPRRQRVLFRWRRRIDGGIAGWRPAAAAARERRVGAGSLEPSAPPPRRTATSCRRGSARRVGATGWGPGLFAGATGEPHRRSEGVARARPLAPPPARARRAGATNGRARATCCTWTSAPTRASVAPGTRHRRSLPARPPGCSATPRRLRLPARGHRRPHPPGLWRTTRRRDAPRP